MILSKNIKIKITTRNLKFYNKKGIKCNIEDIIECPVNKLSLGSHSIVKVKCDYCGRIYNINYNNYNMKTKNGTLLSCCDNVNCMKQKRTSAIQNKYGSDNVFQVMDIKEKIKETNLKLYGVENPHQNTKIKLKAENTNIEKYGTKNPFQSKEVKIKIKQSNLKNHGVEYPTQNRDILYKGFKSGYRIEYIDGLSCQGSYEKDFVLKFKDKVKIENGLSIEYYYNGERKIYHSDYYLPDFNLVVEIKSSYWYEQHLDLCKAKEEYTRKMYNYLMIIDKNYDDFNLIA